MYAGRSESIQTGLLSPEINQKLVDSGIDLVRISLEGLNSEDYKAICEAKIDFDELMQNIADLYARSRGTNVRFLSK